MEDTDIETKYNTLVSLMELISQYNIGSATIASSLSLAAGKILSLQGRMNDVDGK